MLHISEEHLTHWFEHGYTIVDDFLTPEELAAAQKDIQSTFPSREEYLYAPLLYRNDHRGGHMRELPFLGDVLNFIAVSPEIVSFVERALGTKNIALAQSIVWSRYPGVDEFDFPLHVDYMNTSLLYPNERGPFEEVSFLLYYVDVDEQGGATWVVSRRHSGGELLQPYFRPKDEDPELYRHEQPVYVRAGSLLIYSMATFHRPTPIAPGGQTRYSHHIIYRSEAAPWVGYRVWANYGLSSEMQRFVAQASTRQRELLGFPPTGHEYWNEETIAGVASRYPTMDMTPYVETSDIPEGRKERLRKELGQPRRDDTGLGATDYDGGQPTQASEQSATGLAYEYYRGVADYCSIVTGVPARYWLTQLLDYPKGRR